MDTVPIRMLSRQNKIILNFRREQCIKVLLQLGMSLLQLTRADFLDISSKIIVCSEDIFSIRIVFKFKIRAVCHVAPCSPVGEDRRFRGLRDSPDDGGSTHLWNVGLLKRDYKALHPRRLSFSYSPP
jgi:hypothetical protein